MPNPQDGITDEMKAKAVEEADERRKQMDAEEKKTIQDESKKAEETLKPGQKRPTKYTAPGIPADAVKSLLPFYVNIGPKPPGIGPKKFKWWAARHRERKKLRRDLRRNYGIKKRSEFEQIATECGLGIGKGPFAFLFWLFSTLFGTGGLLTLAAAAGLTLLGFFAYSYVTEQVGSFTIQLNPGTMSSGFVLSNDPTFETKTARLDSEQMDEVNAITIEDIAKDVDQIDGQHNGDHYLAYTFYIMNDSDKPSSYEYVLSMTDSIFGVDKSVWVMLFEDGKQILYAAPSADGDAERLAGYKLLPPFYDSAYYGNDDGVILESEQANLRDEEGNPVHRQYYQKDNGTWGIRAKAAEDETTVVRGLVRDVQPGEIHKYTVVIWLEGYDPECTDDLFGGYAKYYMEFKPVDEKFFSMFQYLYRTEYEDYISNRGNTTPETEPEAAPETEPQSEQ